MSRPLIAIDIGITNIDLIIQERADKHFYTFANPGGSAREQVEQAIANVDDVLKSDPVIGVTGGRYRALEETVLGLKIIKVDEMQALGLGGLAMTELDSGLVVSAGTGAAMVAARGNSVEHVTGSAVGGGTLIGLSKLLLNIDNPEKIDRLALQGDASSVDIMLTEAVGGEVGRLPSDANAVNLGKLGQETAFERTDLAAGLVRLVAQVIAVIAINASDAAGLSDIIMVGHLMDLESIQKEIHLVGKFYQRTFTIPQNPGFGTAMGVISILKNSQR